MIPWSINTCKRYTRPGAAASCNFTVHRRRWVYRDLRNPCDPCRREREALVTGSKDLVLCPPPSREIYARRAADAEEYMQ